MTIESLEEYRRTLQDYAYTLFFWGFWSDFPDISDLESIRREFESRLSSCEKTLTDLEDWVAKSGVRLVHSNENPTSHMRTGICSPMKSDEIRSFERQVREVFDLGNKAYAETQWPDSELPNNAIPPDDIRRQLRRATQEMSESVLEPWDEAND